MILSSYGHIYIYEIWKSRATIKWDMSNFESIPLTFSQFVHQFLMSLFKFMNIQIHLFSNLPIRSEYHVVWLLWYNVCYSREIIKWNMSNFASISLDISAICSFVSNVFIKIHEYSNKFVSYLPIRSEYYVWFYFWWFYSQSNVDLYNKFCKAPDEGKEVKLNAVFCDISKALDRVLHKGLLNKVKTVGITGFLLMWFKDYLKDRK